MKILGVDGGIASAGWGVIELDEQAQTGAIMDAGVWMFNAPEEKSRAGTKLKSELRRGYRGQRKLIRRRRQRMGAIRRLFAEHGLLPNSHRDALKIPARDPWALRVAALSHALTLQELAVALGHIARHRGFKSNAKNGGANAPDDDKKMLTASAETKEKLACYETPARMLMEDDNFKEGIERRLRNREGDYSRSLLRDDLEAEARKIIRTQRRLGQSAASEAFEAEYCATAFHQRPLQDSEGRVGRCPFEKEEKRAPKTAPSFELFRLASKLVNLRLIGRPGNARLSPEELQKALADFGSQASFSFSTLRRTIGLPDAVRFEGVKPEEESKRDVAARSGKAMIATNALRKVIGAMHGEMAWRALWEKREILDSVATTLTFRADLDRIGEGLGAIEGLDADLRETLLNAARSGAFDGFAGAAHLSAKALRAIVPGLLTGMTYDAACRDAGYDHTDSIERQVFATGLTGKEALARILKQGRISPELVGSPTARKAIIEILKQVKAVIEHYGMPDRIHIELARDIGKSIDERGRIERGIDRRNKEKDDLRTEFGDEIGRSPREGSDELLKFELWKQQNGRCLYTDDYISPALIEKGDNGIQIDHVLPWSRFGDDTFHNKALCFAKANQDKKNRTPFEWFMADRGEEEWRAFTARVETNPSLKGLAKRNLMLRDAEGAAGRFRNRNLNDTRWICRLVAEALRQVLPDVPDENGELRRRVFVRPGNLTDRLRRAWGLGWLKKDEKGARIPDDRHHALDALIVAVTSESLLQRATRAVQEIEAKGLPYDLPKAFSQALPWPAFPEEAREAVEKVFVARAERRRARGAAHEATIRQVRKRDARQLVYEKKKIAELKLKDLDRLKDAERNHKLAESLRAWIAAGQPKDAPPLSPKGDPVRKVRLESTSKVNVRIHSGGAGRRYGTADRGGIVRVDVFRKPNKKGVFGYFLVPVYPTDIAGKDTPPVRAATSGKPEAEWPVVDESYEFLWSLTPMSYLKVGTAKGDVFEGYYRGMDRSTGAIQLSAHENSTKLIRGIGARTLTVFKKFCVTRLGVAHEVKRESRTWHGKACT